MMIKTPPNKYLLEYVQHFNFVLWEVCFDGTDNSTAIGKEHMDPLFATLNDDCKATVTKYRETLCLAKLSSQ